MGSKMVTTTHFLVMSGYKFLHFTWPKPTLRTQIESVLTDLCNSQHLNPSNLSPLAVNNPRNRIQSLGLNSVFRKINIT